jgi:predicted membrane channel-forming protein YqfA (hemolysin III family)
MLSALFKTPLWVRLRFVSNSTAAKATILVPVIGYLIIFNEKVIDFLNLARAVDAHSGAEVSYRLILIYLGLCSISVGVVVYGWFCPNEVKHYGSASAYVQGDGPSLRGFVIDDIGRLLENSAQRPRLQVISDALQERVRRGVEITDEQFERYRIEMLHLHFEYLNSSHPVARAICVWSYLIGFGLLAIPSRIVFKRVIGILIGMIF